MANATVPPTCPSLILRARGVYGQVVVRGGGESEDWVSTHAISGVRTREKSYQGQQRVLTCTPLSIKWRLRGTGYGPGYVLL